MSTFPSKRDPAARFDGDSDEFADADARNGWKADIQPGF